MRFPHLLTLAAFVAAAPAYGQAPKAADPLSLVPPKAVAVIQVNGVERVQERLNALLKRAIPERADELSKNVRDALAETLAGRDLKGIRGEGRVLVAFSDLEKLPDDITVSFLFPAAPDDFRKKFLTEEERKSLKKDGTLESVQWEDRPGLYYLVDLPGYVAVCSDKAAAQAYAKGEAGGLVKLVSPELTKTFLDADVAVLVNVKEVTAKYGEQVKRLRSVIELFLKGDTIAGVSKSQIDQLRGMVGAGFQVLEDGTAAVLAVEFQPEGVRLRGVAQFDRKSATAEVLDKSKPEPLAQLGTLPAGQVSYSASALGKVAQKTATLLLGSFSASDDDPVANATVDRLVKELAELDRHGTLAAGPMLASGGLELIDSADADKVVATRLTIFKALTKSGSFANVPLKEKPEVGEKAEQLGGFALNSVRLKFDLDRAVHDLPKEVRDTTRASIQRAVGEEMRLWFGTDGKRVVQVVAKDWAEAKALVEGYLSGAKTLAGEEAFQFTRKQLPADANMIIVLDAARSAHSLLGVAKDVKLAEPATGAKTAYIGIALVLKERHGLIEVFIPAAAVEQIYRVLQPALDRRD
jgi:hypothetical protein